ncbi:MAG: DUF2089 domain-containing protein [Flavobacteriales bacterium]|jgi:hypothetical protein|nr:DUF2089 domain-containing protein [Flavobacteriales bacterium]
MQKKLPIICPSCQDGLAVSELSCHHCETKISGAFPLPAILKLNGEEQDFVLDFVMSGGSLKKMAAKMNKSYPTVRNVLDDIIEKLENQQK